MKLQSLFLVLYFGSFHTGSCQIDPITQKSIDDLLEAFLALNNIPALGLSIVKDGQSFYTQGYGNRSIENSTSADNNTLFFIGSISKSFTATIVVKTLSEKFPLLGEFVLDTPIVELIPTYNFTLIDRYRSERTTFRDLLAHRECIEPENLGTLFGAFQDYNELIYRQRYAKEVCQFRTNFVYNNGLFSLAGDVIAAISGIPYLDMVNEFFSELGMNDTVFLQNDDDHDNMPDRARGYYFREGQLRRYNSELYKRFIPLNAAGGILSSAVDMTKYMQFHLNLGRIGNIQVIPEQAMKWFHKSSNPFLNSGAWKTSPEDVFDVNVGYSLALLVGSYNGYLRISHNGYLPPFNSYLSLYPALNLGIFSTSSGPGPLSVISHEVLHNILFDMVNGKNKKTINLKKLERTQTSLDEAKVFNRKYVSSISSDISSVSKLSKISFQAENLTGHYGSALSGEMDITEKVNSTGQMMLYMNYGQFGLAWLRPFPNGTYLLEWESDFLQDFYASGGDAPIPDISVTIDSTKLTLFSSDTVGPIDVYYKDQRLQNLPVTPWSPDSCGI